MEVYGYIYLVKNLVNGKMYFGITINDFDTRYYGNILKNTHNEHLKSSIEKYGIENFEINEQFDVAYSEDDLWDLEDMYMCLYNTLDRRYGYNKRRSGSKRKGHGKHSEESIKKMRESHKQQIANMTEEEKQQWKQKISEAGKGRIVTEETRQKTKQTWKDKSEEEKEKHRRIVSESKKGKPRSEETKRKLRKARSKPVNQYDLDGNYIQTFNSTKEADEWLGVKHQVGDCCRGRTKTCHGFIWKYVEEENIKEREAI